MKEGMGIGEGKQLISVISLLSQEIPDCNSPANVDAAVSFPSPYLISRYKRDVTNGKSGSVFYRKKLGKI